LPLCLLLVLGFVGTSTVCADEKEAVIDDIISVSGTGIVKTAPDICTISLSVTTKGTNVKELQKENAKTMNKILAGFERMDSCSLTEKEVQTSGFSISEVYYPDDAILSKYGKDKTIYQVENSISIETGKLSCIGDIIDTAVSNGANRIDSVTFSLSPEKEQEYRASALAAAVDMASHDAEVVLGTLGRSLGSVQTVNVQQSYNPPVYYGSGDSMAYMIQAESAPAPTPIDPGDVEVTADVSITYRIA
ncbi:MAG: SIMPL domain-containing protein, partial [Candidatus Subteraquimicrobiales bacterium]|nr:SIMPL domain-containing protein [Candidatus Subteraquimicrobiales bacterium]